LANLIGVRGTPAFFINGVFLSGAQPVDAFRAIIDEQVAAGKKAIAGGTVPARVYALLVGAKLPKARGSTRCIAIAIAAGGRHDDGLESTHRRLACAREKHGSSSPWSCFRISNAHFAFVRRRPSKPLAREYGDKLRIVYKSNPLAFHTRAEAAAHFALEARAQKGDVAFWKAHEIALRRQCETRRQRLANHGRSRWASM
jgi:hypothetical protein